MLRRSTSPAVFLCWPTSSEFPSPLIDRQKSLKLFFINHPISLYTLPQSPGLSAIEMHFSHLLAIAMASLLLFTVAQIPTNTALIPTAPLARASASYKALQTLHALAPSCGVRALLLLLLILSVSLPSPLLRFQSFLSCHRKKTSGEINIGQLNHEQAQCVEYALTRSRGSLLNATFLCNDYAFNCAVGTCEIVRCTPEDFGCMVICYSLPVFWPPDSLFFSLTFVCLLSKGKRAALLRFFIS